MNSISWRAAFFINVPFLVVAFVVLFPVYTTVIASLKPGEKVLQNPLVDTAVWGAELATALAGGEPVLIER